MNKNYRQTPGRTANLAVDGIKKANSIPDLDHVVSQFHVYIYIYISIIYIIYIYILYIYILYIYISIISIYIYTHTRNAWALPRRCSVEVPIPKHMLMQLHKIPMGKTTKVLGNIKLPPPLNPKFLWEKQQKY